MTTARKAFGNYSALQNTGKKFYCVKADGAFTVWNDRQGAQGAAYESKMRGTGAAEVLTEAQAKKRGIVK